MATILDVGRIGRPGVPVATFGRREPLAQTFLLAGDVAAIVLGAAAVMLAVGMPGSASFVPTQVASGVCLATGLLVACGAYRVGELDRWRTHLLRLLPALAALSAYAALTGLAAPDASAAWPCAAAALLATLRMTMHAWWVRAEAVLRQAPSVVAAGDPSTLDAVLHQLGAGEGAAAGRPKIRVAAQVGLCAAASAEDLAARCEEIVDAVRRKEAAGVLLALPWRDQAFIRQVADRLGEHAVDVFLVGGLTELRDVAVRPAWLRGLPCVQVVRRPVTGWSALVKGVEDRAIALAAVALLMPLLLATWLAVRLESRGPAIYRQRRMGRDGRPFEILKFRTMYIDRCDSGTGRVTQAARHDPRITRVGRILRRTSLDELPQLFNVLKGDMSIVGPRPHAVAHDEHYGRLIERYAARRRMKPGITGWAQVNGYRGETDTLDKMRKRIEHDLDYIENWSPLLDIAIIMRTVLVGFVHPNAR